MLKMVTTKKIKTQEIEDKGEGILLGEKVDVVVISWITWEARRRSNWSAKVRCT